MPPRINTRRPARALEDMASARPLRVFFTRFDQFRGNVLEFFSDAARTPPERDPLYQLLHKELPFATLIPGSHETPKDWGYTCIRGLYIVYVFRVLRDEEDARRSLMCAVGFVLPQSAMLLFESLTVSDSDLFLELQEASSEALRQIELKKKAQEASQAGGQAGGQSGSPPPAFAVDLGFLTQLLDRRLRFSPERETHFNMRFTGVCGRYSAAALDLARTALLLGLSVGIATRAPISGDVDTASLMMCLGSLQVESLEEDVSPVIRTLAARARSAEEPGALWEGEVAPGSPRPLSSPGPSHPGRMQSILVSPYFLGHVGLAGIVTATPFLGSPDYIFGPRAAELRAESQAEAAKRRSAQGGLEEEAEPLNDSPATSAILSWASRRQSSSPDLLGSAEEPLSGERRAGASSHPLPREHPLKPVFMSGLLAVADSERRAVLLNGAIGVSVEHSVMTRMFDVVILDGVDPGVVTMKAKRGPYFVRTATPQVLISSVVQARFPFLAKKRRPSTLFQTISGFRATGGNLTCDDANAVIQLNTNLYNNLWAVSRGQLAPSDALRGTGMVSSAEELEALSGYLLGHRVPFSRGRCCR